MRVIYSPWIDKVGTLVGLAQQSDGGVSIKVDINGKEAYITLDASEANRLAGALKPAASVSERRGL